MFFNNKKVILISLISLFIFSCDSDDNPVSVSNEIDVDWVLIKNPNMETQGDSPDTVVGYYFFYKESLMDFSNNYVDISLPTNLPIIFNQIGSEDFYISFIYNDESFNFDLGDINYEPILTNFTGIYEGVDRIIYNTDMNYFTVFDHLSQNYIFRTFNVHI